MTQDKARRDAQKSAMRNKGQGYYLVRYNNGEYGAVPSTPISVERASAHGAVEFSEHWRYLDSEKRVCRVGMGLSRKF